MFIPNPHAVPGMFGPALDCKDHRRCVPRECRFCKTQQWRGEICGNCGAPEDGTKNVNHNGYKTTYGLFANETDTAMSERLIAGWGVRLVDRPCDCDGRGLQPNGQVCTCEAGKRLRDMAEQGERKVLAVNGN